MGETEQKKISFKGKVSQLKSGLNKIQSLKHESATRRRDSQDEERPAKGEKEKGSSSKGKKEESKSESSSLKTVKGKGRKRAISPPLSSSSSSEDEDSRFKSAKKKISPEKVPKIKSKDESKAEKRRVAHEKEPIKGGKLENKESSSERKIKGQERKMTIPSSSEVKTSKSKALPKKTDSNDDESKRDKQQKADEAKNKGEKEKSASLKAKERETKSKKFSEKKMKVPARKRAISPPSSSSSEGENVKLKSSKKKNSSGKVSKLVERDESKGEKPKPNKGDYPQKRQQHPVRKRKRAISPSSSSSSSDDENSAWKNRLISSSLQLHKLKHPSNCNTAIIKDSEIIRWFVKGEINNSDSDSSCGGLTVRKKVKKVQSSEKSSSSSESESGEETIRRTKANLFPSDSEEEESEADKNDRDEEAEVNFSQVAELITLDDDADEDDYINSLMIKQEPQVDDGSEVIDLVSDDDEQDEEVPVQEVDDEQEKNLQNHENQFQNLFEEGYQQSQAIIDEPAEDESDDDEEAKNQEVMTSSEKDAQDKEPDQKRDPGKSESSSSDEDLPDTELLPELESYESDESQSEKSDHPPKKKEEAKSKSLPNVTQKPSKSYVVPPVVEAHFHPTGRGKHRGVTTVKVRKDTKEESRPTKSKDLFGESDSSDKGEEEEKKKSPIPQAAFYSKKSKIKSFPPPKVKLSDMDQKRIIKERRKKLQEIEERKAEQKNRVEKGEEKPSTSGSSYVKSSNPKAAAIFTDEPIRPKSKKSEIMKVNPDGTRSINKMTFDNALRDIDDHCIKEQGKRRRKSGDDQQQQQQLKPQSKSGSAVEMTSKSTKNAKIAQKSEEVAQRPLKMQEEKEKEVESRLQSLNLNPAPAKSGFVKSILKTSNTPESMEKKCLTWKSDQNLVRVLEFEKHIVIDPNRDILKSRLNAGIQKVILEDYYFEFLKWNPVWLKEQKRLQKPPPVQGALDINHVTPKFSNYEDYKNVLLPLMLHELWNEIYENYVKNINQVSMYSGHRLIRPPRASHFWSY